MSLYNPTFETKKKTTNGGSGSLYVNTPQTETTVNKTKANTSSKTVSSNKNESWLETANKKLGNLIDRVTGGVEISTDSNPIGISNDEIIKKVQQKDAVKQKAQEEHKINQFENTKTKLDTNYQNAVERNVYNAEISNDDIDKRLKVIDSITNTSKNIDEINNLNSEKEQLKQIQSDRQSIDEYSKFQNLLSKGDQDAIDDYVRKDNYSDLELALESSANKSSSNVISAIAGISKMIDEDADVSEIMARSNELRKNSEDDLNLALEGNSGLSKLALKYGGGNGVSLITDAVSIATGSYAVKAGINAIQVFGDTYATRINEGYSEEKSINNAVGNTVISLINNWMFKNVMVGTDKVLGVSGNFNLFFNALYEQGASRNLIASMAFYLSKLTLANSVKNVAVQSAQTLVDAQLEGGVKSIEDFNTQLWDGGNFLINLITDNLSLIASGAISGFTGQLASRAKVNTKQDYNTAESVKLMIAESNEYTPEQKELLIGNIVDLQSEYNSKATVLTDAVELPTDISQFNATGKEIDDLAYDIFAPDVISAVKGNLEANDNLDKIVALNEDEKVAVQSREVTKLEKNLTDVQKQMNKLADDWNNGVLEEENYVRTADELERNEIELNDRIESAKNLVPRTDFQNDATKKVYDKLPNSVKGRLKMLDPLPYEDRDMGKYIVELNDGYVFSDGDQGRSVPVLNLKEAVDVIKNYTQVSDEKINSLRAPSNGIEEQVEQAEKLTPEKIIEKTKDLPDTLKENLRLKYFREIGKDYGNFKASGSYDNDGLALSKGQEQFYKDSKAVDKFDGSLLHLYFGTDATFTVPDVSFSDDGISLFMTTNPSIAESYQSESVPQYVQLNDNEEMPEGGKVVEVYANVTNPVDLECRNLNWDELNQTMRGYATDNGKLRLAKVDNENGKLTVRIDGEEPITINEDEVDSYFDMSNYDKYDDYTYAYTITGSGDFKDDFVVLTGLNTTREIAEFARINGYDGVIFRDLFDISGKNAADNGLVALNDEDVSTVVCAFNEGQIKSVNNFNPTNGKDMREPLNNNVDDLASDIKTPTIEQKEIDPMEITDESLKSFIKETETPKRSKYQNKDNTFNTKKLREDLNKEVSKFDANRKQAISEFKQKYDLTDDDYLQYVGMYYEYKATTDLKLKAEIRKQMNEFFPQEADGKYQLGMDALKDMNHIMNAKDPRGEFKERTHQQEIVDADEFVRQIASLVQEGEDIDTVIQELPREYLYDVSQNGVVRAKKLLDYLYTEHSDNKKLIKKVTNDFKAIRGYSGQLLDSNKTVLDFDNPIDRMLYIEGAKSRTLSEAKVKYGDKLSNDVISKIENAFNSFEEQVMSSDYNDNVFKNDFNAFVKELHDFLPKTKVDEIFQIRINAMLSGTKSPIKNALGNFASFQGEKLTDLNAILVQNYLINKSKDENSRFYKLLSEDEKSYTLLDRKKSEENNKISTELFDKLVKKDSSKYSVNGIESNFIPDDEIISGLKGYKKKLAESLKGEENKTWLDKWSSIEQTLLSDRKAMKRAFVYALDMEAQAKGVNLSDVKEGSELYYKLTSKALERAETAVHHEDTALNRVIKAATFRSGNSITFSGKEGSTEKAIKTYLKDLKTRANEGRFWAKVVDGAIREFVKIKIPFAKTNAAITSKNFDYLTGARAIFESKKWADDVKNGKATTDDFIKKVSRNMAGAEIALVGMALATSGILKYEREDDDYSGHLMMKVPNGYTTLDFLDPIAAVLSVGVSIADEIKEYGIFGEKAYEEIGKDIYNIFREQSLDMFSNTFDFFEDVYHMVKGEDEYGNEYTFGNLVADTLFDFISSLIPTIIKDITKIVIPEMKETYDSDNKAKTLFQRLINNTPFRGMLEDKKDATGSSKVYTQPYTSNDLINRIITNLISPGKLVNEEGDMIRGTTPTSSNKMSEEQIKDYQKLVEKYSYTDEDNNGYSDKHWLRASVPSNFYFDGKQVELASADKSEYGKEWSSVWTSSASALESNKTYQALNEENKVDVIYNAQTMATRLESAKYGKANGLDLSDTQKEALALEGYYTKDGNIDSNKLALISMATSVDNNNHSLFRDTYSDGETVNGSSALNVLKMYQENGVLDEIIKYCKNNDVDYSAFGLSKDIVKSYQKKDVIITMDDEDRLSYYEVRRDISEIRRDLEDTKEVGKDVDYKTPTIEAINNSNLTDKVKNYVYDSYYESDFTKITNTLSVDDKTKYNVKIANATIESDKDENGKTISGSKSKKLVEEYKKLGVLNELVNYVKTNGLEPSIIGLTKSDYNSLIGKSSSSSVSRGTKTYKDKLLSAMSSVSSKSTPSLGKYYTSQDFKDSKNSTSNSSYMKAYKKQMAKMLKNL